MARKHISTEVKYRVRKEARSRCGYCLVRQDLIYHLLQIEHIIPVSKGGTNDELNLWLACERCNGHKSDKISAIDAQTWPNHCQWQPRLQCQDLTGFFIFCQVS